MSSFIVTSGVILNPWNAWFGIDKNDNVYNFVIFGDPYRVVLAPGSYTIVIDDMSGEYNNQQICSYFTIKDNEYEKLEFKFNKDVKTKVK